MVRNETQKIFTTKGIFGKYIQSFRGKGEWYQLLVKYGWFKQSGIYILEVLVV
jgi:hypothetical protein